MQLTDGQQVPLWISSTVFAVLLAVVFAIWYARERTLSIHAVTTVSREGFYWLTVLVTFTRAPRSADWTVKLTGIGVTARQCAARDRTAAVYAAWKLGPGRCSSLLAGIVLTAASGR